MILSRRAGLVFVCVLSLAAGPLAAQGACALGAVERAWIQGALDDWDAASREALRLEPRPLPWMVFIDTACAWHVAADASGDADLAATLSAAGAPLRFQGGAVEVRAVAHDGRVRLPGGQRVPAAPLSFAAPYGDAGAAFFVIGMPAVWTRDPRHAADPDLAWLIRAVFVHEMTHTMQVGHVYRHIDALATHVPDPETLNDDVIQTRFDSVPEFRRGVEGEIALLYRAMDEPGTAARREMVASALRMAEGRRARWFNGQHAAYAELEDVFLDMEGVAQWAAYSVALRNAPADTDPGELLTRFRRGGRFWSQDLGLALYLALDELVPGWQARVWGPEHASVRTLLTEAVR